MQEWLSGLVGESRAPIVSWVLYAAIVALLAFVVISLAKRVFAGSGGIGGRTRAPRLAILDVTAVDPKRKLVLVRRDDTEHLLLIGGQNDLVVEGGIQRVRTRRVEAPAAGRIDPEPAVEPAPAAVPVRRVPVATPKVAASARALPVAEPEPAQPVAPPVRAPAPQPMQAAEPEPADLRIAPTVRALPQDAPMAPTGERQVTSRPTSPEEANLGAVSPPPLPAFLGVLGPRTGVAAQRPPIAPPVPERAPARPESVRPEPARPEPKPSMEPTASEPAAPAPPRAAPVLPPFPQRSMATPTLPPQPAPPAVRSEEPAARRAEPAPPAPMILADEPLLPTEDPTPPPVSPRPADAGTTATAGAERSPAPERQPLSVRSFATTIQARRAPTPAAPVAAPLEPVDRTDDAQHAEPAPDEPRRAEPAAPPAPARPADAAPARPLTLEEEMERLLHDFTLDVSERR